jgi:MFS family permease
MPYWLTPFLMLCLVGFSARLGYQMARPPVLPRFAAELGADAWLIGLILGASTLTGVLIKFPAGALSDVLGRRRILLLGAAFFAFPPFLYLLVQDAYTLLGLRFLRGLATAIFSPVASAAVADLFKAGRGEKLGWFASANEFGSAFGPLLGGALSGGARWARALQVLCRSRHCGDAGHARLCPGSTASHWTHECTGRPCP